MKKLFFSLFLALSLVTQPLLVPLARATVVVDDSTDSYTGNGSTTTFAYNYKISDQTHIKVLVDNVVKVLSTDYSVTGVGNSAGGTVVFVTAPVNAAKVVLVRNTPLNQLSNYLANEAYPPLRVMGDLDKLTMIVQQLNELVARAYKVIEGQTQPALPNVCTGSQKMVGYDVNGQISCATDLNAAAATANQWDQITAPTGNAAFSHGNNRTTFTFGAATGANPTFRLTDTASNTGTGAILQLDTASGSTAKPFQATAGGTDNGVRMSTTGSLGKIGTGAIIADSLAATLAIANGGTGQVTQTAAFNALDPLTTKGDLVIHDGTNSVRFPVCGTDRYAVGDSAQTSGWRCNTTNPIQTGIVKAADETVNNSTALQDDDHLVFAVAANTSYLVEMMLLLNATGQAADWKFGWTLPVGGTMFWGSVGAATLTTGNWFVQEAAGVAVIILANETQTVLINSQSGTHGARITAIVRVAGTAGNLQFQWAQNTATVADSKILKDSTMRVTKIQ